MKRGILGIIPLLLFMAVAAYFALGLTRYDPDQLDAARLNQPVPDFTTPALKADRPGLAAADLKGEPQLLNVFASWCVPCRAEHPLITRLAESGITVNGLNWKDDPVAARAWLAELGDPYTRIGADASGRAGIELGVYGVPETYVIDAGGVIRFRHAGPLQERHLRDEILPLLARLRAETASRP